MLSPMFSEPINANNFLTSFSRPNCFKMKNTPAFYEELYHYSCLLNNFNGINGIEKLSYNQFLSETLHVFVIERTPSPKRLLVLYNFRIIIVSFSADLLKLKSKPDTAVNIGSVAKIVVRGLLLCCQLSCLS